MEKRGWLRRNFVRLLTILFVIAITVSIFFYRDKIAELESYGYLGVFLVTLVSNATIILPVPGIIIVLALGTALSPVLLGLVAGIGAAIGEITAYMAGYSGRGLVENRKLYDRLAGWLRKWGVIVIFVFAVTPMPFDLMGIVAGVLRFPIWKFLIACWLGKTILYIITALLGALWWEAALRFFS